VGLLFSHRFASLSSSPGWSNLAGFFCSARITSHFNWISADSCIHAARKEVSAFETMRTSFALILLSVTLAFCPQAESVSLSFSGRITDVILGDDGFEPNTYGVSAGDVFTGRLNYILPQTDTYPGPRLGVYNPQELPLLRVSIHGKSFGPEELFSQEIDVVDGFVGSFPFPDDRIQASVGSVSDDFYALNFFLINPAGTVLSSDSLPTSLDLANWPSRFIVLEFIGPGELNGPVFVGTIQNWSVPDSANSATMLALGIAGLFLSWGRWVPDKW